ncbi:MAG: hypothetical protein HY672_04265 [Chloroflexi bacterium]|nr:hypothetical protein [Chloroflexota bacterium]
MDGDFRINLEELLRNIDSAEVISIYFPLLRRTILIDTRFTAEDPPMVKVVPMAASVEERNRALRKLRPHFPRPKSITIVPWPKYVESLVRLGVWRKVLGRFVESGHRETVEECNRVLEDVHRLEMEELSAVIKGENYHTMWARSR